MSDHSKFARWKAEFAATHHPEVRSLLESHPGYPPVYVQDLWLALDELQASQVLAAIDAAGGAQVAPSVAVVVALVNGLEPKPRPLKAKQGKVVEVRINGRAFGTSAIAPAQPVCDARKVACTACPEPCHQCSVGSFFGSVHCRAKEARREPVKFQPGDVVQLKSGGLRMTVYHAANELHISRPRSPEEKRWYAWRVRCIWFDGQLLKRDEFGEDEIVHAKGDQ